MTVTEKRKLNQIFTTISQVQASLEQFNGKVVSLEKHGETLQDTVSLMLKSVNRLEEFQEKFQLKDNWMFELAAQIGLTWRSDFELFKQDVLGKIEVLEKSRDAESKRVLETQA